MSKLFAVYLGGSARAQALSCLLLLLAAAAVIAISIALVAGDEGRRKWLTGVPQRGLSFL